MTYVYKHMFLKNTECVFGIWLKTGSGSSWGASCHLAEFPMPVTQFWREGVGDGANVTNMRPQVSGRARSGSWQSAWGSGAPNHFAVHLSIN